MQIFIAQNNNPMSTTPTSFSTENHEFRPASPYDSRSPCPALNSLANHGYISRKGYDLSFFEIVHATVFVYNLSYPLACVLALAGFISCGRISFERRIKSSHETNAKQSWTQLLFLPMVLLLNIPLFFLPRFVIDLSSLSSRGYFKISHDASFVHRNSVPSTAPSPNLLKRLLKYASTRRELGGKYRNGLGLIDIARFHVGRVQSAPLPLTPVHLQIALGECALTWETLRGHQCYHGPAEHNHGVCILKGRVDGVIPISRLEQWFGEERLPDGWWEAGGVRPSSPIGLVRARVTANFIGILAIKSSELSTKCE